MRILVVIDTEGIRDSLVDSLVGAGETDFLELNIDLPEDTEEGRKKVERAVVNHYAYATISFIKSTRIMIFPKDEVQESMRFFMGYPPFTKKESIEETYMADGKLINAEQLAEGYADTCDDWFPEDTPLMFVEWAKEVLDEGRRA